MSDDVPIIRLHPCEELYIVVLVIHHQHKMGEPIELSAKYKADMKYLQHFCPVRTWPTEIKEMWEIIKVYFND